jgi:replication fork clamp-binding protein CrfC
MNLHSQSCSNLFAGVLTKLDIMDRGTNALGMLHNDVLPLRLGYIAVVNRSQYDIQEKTPVTIARQKEKEFFSEQSEYASVAAQCGIMALSKRCD